MANPDPAFLAVRDRIMVPGSVSVFTDEAQVVDAIVSVGWAHEQGHAIIYDETFEEGKFVCAHVLHYRTCKKCREEKNVH